MRWENCFAQLIIKVIGKRKPFKTNNLSEVLYSLHISNALTMGGERLMNALEASCTTIHAIHNCSEYNLALQEGPFCSIIVRGWITSLRQS